MEPRRNTAHQMGSLSLSRIYTEQLRRYQQIIYFYIHSIAESALDAILAITPYLVRSAISKTSK